MILLITLTKVLLLLIHFKHSDGDYNIIENDNKIIRNDATLFNFASQGAGAVILDKSKESNGFKNLLNDDKDAYGITKCSEDKWVVVGLSEDILVTAVEMANYERYSSMLKDFQLLASATYPTDHWIDLGSYTAQPILGTQHFNITSCVAGYGAHTRYLRVNFLTHYMNELYCTLSQIKVFGMTVIASFKQEVERSDDDMRGMLEHLNSEVDLDPGNIDLYGSALNYEELSNSNAEPVDTILEAELSQLTDIDGSLGENHEENNHQDSESNDTAQSILSRNVGIDTNEYVENIQDSVVLANIDLAVSNKGNNKIIISDEIGEQDSNAILDWRSSSPKQQEADSDATFEPLNSTKPAVEGTEGVCSSSEVLDKAHREAVGDEAQNRYCLNPDVGEVSDSTITASRTISDVTNNITSLEGKEVQNNGVPDDSRSEGITGESAVPESDGSNLATSTVNNGKSALGSSLNASQILELDSQKEGSDQSGAVDITDSISKKPNVLYSQWVNAPIGSSRNIHYSTYHASSEHSALDIHGDFQAILDEKCKHLMEGDEASEQDLIERDACKAVIDANDQQRRVSSISSAVQAVRDHLLVPLTNSFSHFVPFTGSDSGNNTANTSDSANVTAVTNVESISLHTAQQRELGESSELTVGNNATSDFTSDSNSKSNELHNVNATESTQDGGQLGTPFLRGGGTQDTGEIEIDHIKAAEVNIALADSVKVDTGLPNNDYSDNEKVDTPVDTAASCDNSTTPTDSSHKDDRIHSDPNLSMVDSLQIHAESNINTNINTNASVDDPVLVGKTESAWGVSSINGTIGTDILASPRLNINNSNIANTTTVPLMLSTVSNGSSTTSPHFPGTNVPMNCFETMSFSDFQRKMKAKLQAKSNVTGFNQALGLEAVDSVGAATSDNVFRVLMQKIKTLEMNNAIVEMYTIQMSECYRHVTRELLNRTAVDDDNSNKRRDLLKKSKLISIPRWLKSIAEVIMKPVFVLVELLSSEEGYPQ